MDGKRTATTTKLVLSKETVRMLRVNSGLRTGASPSPAPPPTGTCVASHTQCITAFPCETVDFNNTIACAVNA